MNNVIDSLSYEENIIQLRLRNVPKHPLMITKIFDILSNKGINIDMISEVMIEDSMQIDITLDQDQQPQLNEAIVVLMEEFEGIEIYQDRKYSKVAIGGDLMETTPGIAAKVFKLLGENSIHFYQITTSKRTISFVIKKEKLELALTKIKEYFNI